MENIIKELKDSKVIDKEDVIKFKAYINYKYNSNKSSENAKVLSKTINQVISDKLINLPEELKASIIFKIIKSTFANSKTAITLFDIFDVCIKDENVRKSFNGNIIKWLDKHLNVEVTVDEIDSYIVSIQKEKEEADENQIKYEEIKAVSSNNCLGNEDKDYFSIKTKSKVITTKVYCAIAGSIAIILFIVIGVNLHISTKDYKIAYNKKINHPNISSSIKIGNNSSLPKYMKYKDIDVQKLKMFLTSRNSILCNEPYFSTIIANAKQFNINPILLFSITGQEENFVPKNLDNAAKIANNPFNVFHSWKKYNTDIDDSSRIAARTINNISMNMPSNADPFSWIGSKYAEDKSWASGVKQIFEQLTQYTN